jgi:hypothetical protein
VQQTPDHRQTSAPDRYGGFAAQIALAVIDNDLSEAFAERRVSGRFVDRFPGQNLTQSCGPVLYQAAPGLLGLGPQLVQLGA